MKSEGLGVYFPNPDLSLFNKYLRENLQSMTGQQKSETEYILPSYRTLHVI